MSVQNLANVLTVCALCATVPVAHADTSDLEGTALEFFDSFSDTPADVEFLSPAEVHDLIREYPVFCENTETSQACNEISFDSETTGMMRGQYFEDDVILMRAYAESPFHNTDTGMCLPSASDEEEFEIIAKDNELSRIMAAEIGYIMQILDKYVSLDCVKFSYPESTDDGQAGLILEMYESYQLTTGAWKFVLEPNRVVLSKTWPMERLGFGFSR